jgi:hypothetical protein
VLADLSINHVERQVLLCGFSVDRVQHDYGYDLTVATHNDAGEIEPGAVYLQVKATDRLPRLAGGATIPWLVSRRDLRLWLEEVYPVEETRASRLRARLREELRLLAPFAWFPGRRMSSISAGTMADSRLEGPRHGRR